MQGYAASRQTVAAHRRALRTEENRFSRAAIYLELARLYRVLGRMKNARLELQRAMAAIGLEWPRNSWWATFAALLRAGKSPSLHEHCQKQTDVARTSLFADIYEEIGLSAYYLQQRPLLVRSIIETYAACRKLGPSRALLNWYGGGACVLVLIKLRRQGQAMLRKCGEVAAALGTPDALAKQLIWAALMEDYQGEPVRSAELFEKCLADYGTLLGAWDLRLVTITLALNYLTRGYAEESLLALDRFPSVAENRDDWSLNSAAWYRLGPEAFLGRTAQGDDARATFQSILTVDRDERWRLAQFLGQLLIVERAIGPQICRVNDMVDRFNVLGMSPRQTHFETCFFWIALAYVRLELALGSKDLRADFEKSARAVRRLPGHPTNSAHDFFFRAALAKMKGHEKASRDWALKSRLLAEATQNRWVLRELERSLPRC